MTTQVMEQTQVFLDAVIAAGKEHHFYFREVSRDTYKGNWVFTPIEYCNLNHDERKRVAVVDLCGIPVKGFLRAHEVVAVQQVTLPRIQVPWKFIAGAVGAVLVAVLVIPLIVGLVIALGVVLLASVVALVDPATIAIIDDGTPDGRWLELMFFYETPPFTLADAPKE